MIKWLGCKQPRMMHWNGNGDKIFVTFRSMENHEFSDPGQLIIADWNIKVTALYGQMHFELLP